MAAKLKPLRPHPALVKIADFVPADYVVLGNVEKKDSSYFMTLAAVRVTSGAVIDSEAIDLHSLEFLASLSSPPSQIDEITTYRAGVNGISMPDCIKSPDPSYSDTARAAKMEGKCELLVVVSAEGTAKTSRT